MSGKDNWQGESQGLRNYAELFDDELAAKVSWSPTKSRGTGSNLPNLVEVSSQRLEFRGSGCGKFIFGLFFAAATAVMISGMSRISESDDEGLSICALGLIWAVASGGGLILASTKMTFDKRAKGCWKGRRQPGGRNAFLKRRHAAPLDEIHAVQVIKEETWDSDGRSQMYCEINLVMHDGTRLHATYHTQGKPLQEAAKQLGKFIEVPVWDSL